jgi:hypothetical protein
MLARYEKIEESFHQLPNVPLAEKEATLLHGESNFVLILGQRNLSSPLTFNYAFSSTPKHSRREK